MLRAEQFHFLPSLASGCWFFPVGCSRTVCGAKGLSPAVRLVDFFCSGLPQAGSSCSSPFSQQDTLLHRCMDINRPTAKNTLNAAGSSGQLHATCKRTKSSHLSPLGAVSVKLTLGHRKMSCRSWTLPCETPSQGRKAGRSTKGCSPPPSS